MKRIKCLILALVASASFVAMPATAHAATEVTPQVSISIYGNDISRLENSDYQMAYNSSKNDTDNPYQFSYKAEMDMSSVWTQYKFFRALYLMQNTVEQWKTKVMVAEWTLSANFDVNYVNLDSNLLTKEAVQARFEELNSETEFFRYVKCYSSEYDSSTGEWTAKFRLETDGKEGALAYLFDSIQPGSLEFSTPENLVTVKQSAFEGGKSFTTTNMKLSGSLSIQAMYLSQLPINFNSAAESAGVNMVGGPKFNIVDDYKIGEQTNEDRILVIARTGDTGEIANTSFYPSGSYDNSRNLKVQIDDKDMTEDQISAIKWQVKGAGGYSDDFAKSVVTIEDGKINVKANKAGIVEIIGTYNDSTSSIYVVVPGDANRDTLVNSRDFSGLVAYVAKTPTLPDDGFTFFSINMNGDDEINSRDTTILKGMCDKTISPSN